MNPSPPESSTWFDPAACKVSDLAALVQTATRHADCPRAATVWQGVPLYDCAQLRTGLAADGAGEAARMALMAEWAQVWEHGPGMVVLQGAFDDPAVVNGVTGQFQAMVAEGRKTGAGGDHFAKPGANDRVWNALEKLCLQAPALFAAYYSNDMLALACTAWLGPAYQVTSQVNCVNPGGRAQMAHRDYHLGYYPGANGARFPAQVHRLSPMLTLQGAVAHVDMPLESGPTLYLPHSQKYAPGYLVGGHPEFQAFFDAHHVQLPLKKGDAVFFNPALMHAAGNNRSADILRMANLLQVSSAFGRCMESVDRMRMSLALYPTLLAHAQQGRMTPAQIDCALAASAEGYAFPTNLDRDPPLGGLAAPSQQDLMRRALAEQWPLERVSEALQVQADKKIA
jgi:ectoine hydroxylase-related dioxygenase (phytanoyl-CoA dioxygenase family)